MPVSRSLDRPGRALHHALLIAVHLFAAAWSIRTSLDVASRGGAGRGALMAALALCTALAGARTLRLLRAWQTGRWTESDLVPFRQLAYALGAGALVFLVWWQPFVRRHFDVALAFALGGFVVLDASRELARRHVPARLLRIADLGLANLLLIVVLLELGLRGAAWLWPSPLFLQENSTYLDRMDCNRLAPGFLHFGFPCDSRGFYDHPPEERDPGDRFVVTIGDSFSTSIVPHVYHYTTVAERRAPWCEIYNAGIPGVGPAAYLWLLRHELLPLEPDAVVVALFLGNDVFETSRKVPDRALRMWLDRRNLLIALVPERLLKMARERRELGAVAAVQGEGLPFTGLDPDQLFGQQPWHADPTLEEPTFTREAFLEIERLRASGACGPDVGLYEALFDDLRAMKDACGATPFHVLLIPDQFQVEDELWRDVATPKLDREQPQRLIANWLGEQGIPYLDLLPILRAVEPFADGQRHLYHQQDTHFNVRGNRVAGEALAEHLARHRGLGEVTELVAPEGPLVIDRPGVPFALPIRVRHAGGEVRELRDALPGIELSSSDPAVAAVSQDGRVLAGRRGDATIEARVGAHTCTLRIEARWPAALDLGQGRADGGAAPRLRLARGEPRAGQEIELAVEGLPPGASAHLAIQDRPVLGGILPFDFAPYDPPATSTLPFVVERGTAEPVARIRIPLPDDPGLVDSAMFVVAVFRDPELPDRLRLSNVLALTLDARDSPR